MKTFFKFFIIAGFILCLSSCAKNGKIYKGVVQGMYEGANQSQEMKNDDPKQQIGKQPPSYDQYEKERKEIIKDKNK